MSFVSKLEFVWDFGRRGCRRDDGVRGNLEGWRVGIVLVVFFVGRRLVVRWLGDMVK